ncbi:MAG TPA: alanine racemase [Longimicrobiales bacterium]|nr:alanine racemase [Longimicrobiales bacterium]
MVATRQAFPSDLDRLATPAAIVDLDVMEANLARVADYARAHTIALRPHAKTHKTAALAAEQVARGAVGVTVATAHEAEVMATAVSDILVAYPPVGPARIARLLALPESVRVSVALDSIEALEGLAEAAAARGREAGVLVELDVGMHRVGVQTPEAALELARRAATLRGVRYEGVLCYPGHIREHVSAQEPALRRLAADLEAFLDALERGGLAPRVVSGGSTPTLFASHRIPQLSEMRPGTYIFNDRTTAAIGACAWTDCAYSVLATVVSTAVPGQAAVDAGSKALNREDIRGVDAPGFGALLDRPGVVVKAMSEEHGLLDLAATDWQPRVGERVRIVPNHVCISVNLHEWVHGVRAGVVERSWSVAARGWD